MAWTIDPTSERLAWHRRDVLNQFVQAINCRLYVRGIAATGRLPLVEPGDLVQAASFIRSMQQAVEQSASHFSTSATIAAGPPPLTPITHGYQIPWAGGRPERYTAMTLRAGQGLNPAGFTRRYPRTLASLSDPGQDGWRAWYAGEGYRYTGGQWHRATVQPDVLTDYGLCQRGDYIGEWIWRELYLCINAMTHHHGLEREPLNLLFGTRFIGAAVPGGTLAGEPEYHQRWEQVSSNATFDSLRATVEGLYDASAGSTFTANPVEGSSLNHWSPSSSTRREALLLRQVFVPKVSLRYGGADIALHDLLDVNLAVDWAGQTLGRNQIASANYGTHEDVYDALGTPVAEGVWTRVGTTSTNHVQVFDGVIHHCQTPIGGSVRPGWASDPPAPTGGLQFINSLRGYSLAVLIPPGGTPRCDGVYRSIDYGFSYRSPA